MGQKRHDGAAVGEASRGAVGVRGDDRYGEPEGGPHGRLGDGADLAPKHSDLLAADAEAQAGAPRSSGPLHIVLCALDSEGPRISVSGLQHAMSRAQGCTERCDA